MTGPRVAIVHERFTELGGSEFVVEQLARQWPEATVHAAIVRDQGLPPGLRDRVAESWLGVPYRWSGHPPYAPFLPLLPSAFRHLAVGDPDVVIVSHHAFATQVVHATSAPVVAYVHSPARWAWDASLRVGEAGGRAGAVALSLLSARTRRDERSAAGRLHKVIANSSAVSQRIQCWWGRSAEVVHPPVDTEFFTPDSAVDKEDFFLLAGRLVPYKRPDLAVRAAREAGVRLVVAGEGRFLDRCRELAGRQTIFLGRVSDQRLRDLHRRSRALLMPGLEDFGIVPVEAMACGTPVIALGGGGALDTVVPGVSGVLVPIGDDEMVVEGFVRELRSHQLDELSPRSLRSHAETFSRASFRQRMRSIVALVP